MPCSSEDENRVRNIGKICFLAAQAGIRWKENGKRAYILDARSGGGSVIEVPNPIDFRGSYEDFYRMLLTSFSYFDATDLFRKLHTPTLLISKSYIQPRLGVDLLKCDTMHHACGIPVRKEGAGGDVVIQGQKAVGEQSLYWRWLIIDEFGMVGSSLLAEVDMKLRDVVVDVNPHKKTHSGHVRPFGGLNVLLSGDLWQLPPPSGRFLGNIPAE